MARAIFTTLAMMIFSGSIILNVYLLLFTGLLSSNERKVVSKTLIDGDARQKIAVVSLSGVILDDSARQMDALLSAVEADGGVRALVLQIDSPGGGVTASDEIYARLLQFKQRTQAPVVVSMGALATSGGYYVSCAADRIVAERTTLTGNIGVLLPRINLSGLGKKLGVEDATVTSSGAEYKNAGSIWKTEQPNETAYLRDLIDASAQTFKSVVQTGRAGSLTKGRSIDEIANGKVYSAAEALRLGLVDQIGYLDDAIKLAGSVAGLKNQTVVRYTFSKPLFAGVDGPAAGLGLGGVAPGGVSPEGAGARGLRAGGLGSDGVRVDLDQRLYYELTTSRPMYLWRQ